MQTAPPERGGAPVSAEAIQESINFINQYVGGGGSRTPPAVSDLDSLHSGGMATPASYQYQHPAPLSASAVWSEQSYASRQPNRVPQQQYQMPAVYASNNTPATPVSTAPSTPVVPAPQPVSEPFQQQSINTNSGGSGVPFADIVQLLRARYATDKSLESASGLETMSREDVAGLVECFAQDLENAVNKARRRSGAPPLPKPKTSKEQEQDAKKGGNAPKVDQKGVGVSDKPLQPVSIQDPAAVKNIKEAMSVLRGGCQMVKFSSSKGSPSLRAIRVVDRRSVFRGEMVLMPHFCWFVGDSTDPSNQLALLELRDVRTGPSQDMKRNEQGYVIDSAGSIVHDDRCLTVVFPQRKVMLAAPTAQLAAVWVKCLLLVADKNRTLKRERR